MNVDVNNGDIVQKNKGIIGEKYEHLIADVFTKEMDIENWEDDDDSGLVLASVSLANLKSIPSRAQILKNLNDLIADIGSTNNTTDSMLGAFYIKRYKGPPTKTATNEDMVITSVFDFNGMTTDQYGHEKKLALFESFKYIPGAPYTLVAIGKYLLKG